MRQPTTDAREEPRFTPEESEGSSRGRTATVRHTVDDCRLVDLPTVGDEKGVLNFIESRVHIPFSIARVFYLYDVPKDGSRAGHALKSCEQFLIPLNGRFDVVLDDGFEKRSIPLDSPRKGLYIPPLVWRDLLNFTPGTTCLALASEAYSEDNYYRDYTQFRAIVGSSRP